MSAQEVFCQYGPLADIYVAPRIGHILKQLGYFTVERKHSAILFKLLGELVD